MEELKYNKNTFILGALIGVLVIGFDYGLTYWKGYQPYNRIPTDRKIEVGYTNPSRLEIKLEDLNKNGFNETLLNYDEKSYLLREVDGKPVILDYEIKPVEIVPE